MNDSDKPPGMPDVLWNPMKGLSNLQIKQTSTPSPKLSLLSHHYVIRMDAHTHKKDLLAKNLHKKFTTIFNFHFLCGASLRRV
jgi:hypothetical protein